MNIKDYQKHMNDLGLNYLTEQRITNNEKITEYEAIISVGLELPKDVYAKWFLKKTFNGDSTLVEVNKDYIISDSDIYEQVKDNDELVRIKEMKKSADDFNDYYVEVNKHSSKDPYYSKYYDKRKPIEVEKVVLFHKLVPVSEDELKLQIELKNSKSLKSISESLKFFVFLTLLFITIAVLSFMFG